MSRMRLLLSTAAVSALVLGLSLDPAAAQQTQTQQQRPADRDANKASAGKMDSAKFAKEAAVTDAFEIEAAKVALEKSRNDGVRRFAQHMIDEHTKMSAQLKAAAANQPAPEMDRTHRQKLEDLRKESAANFDRKYIQMQVEGHQAALKLHDGYAKNGDDAGLKKVATEAVPHVQAHLRDAQNLQRQTAAAPAAQRPAGQRAVEQGPAEPRR